MVIRSVSGRPISCQSGADVAMTNLPTSAVDPISCQSGADVAMT